MKECITHHICDCLNEELERLREAVKRGGADDKLGGGKDPCGDSLRDGNEGASSVPGFPDAREVLRKAKAKSTLSRGEEKERK